MDARYLTESIQVESDHSLEVYTFTQTDTYEMG